MSPRKWPALLAGLLLLACGRASGSATDRTSEQRAALSATGLLAAYGFDEGSGEEVHDATGAGHDTARSGQAWVGGRYGGALQFDGSFLTVTNSQLLDLTTAMTVSAWVLPKAGEPVEAPLLVKANEHQWEVSYILKAGTEHHGPDWTLFGSSWGGVTSDTRLPLTKWSHLAGTYDGAWLRLYIDGQLSVETEFEGRANAADTPLRIGGAAWGEYFRGRVDEVRIYNRALSASEIAAVMSEPVTEGATADVTAPTVSLTAPAEGAASGLVGLTAQASDQGGVASVEFLVDGAVYGPAVAFAPYQGSWHAASATPGSHELRARATDFAGNVSISAPVTVSVDATDTVPGLVAAFGFDEGGGEDVHDATGAGHDTVRSGQSWVVGKYGSALEFDDGFLDIENSHLLDLTTAMTVSAWVLPTAGELANLTLLAKEYDWETSYVLNAAAWHGGPELMVLGSSWGSVSRQGPLPTTRWSHLAGTYDGTWLRLYVDGALAAETEFQDGIRVSDTPLRIGGTTWGNNFHGRIDEVRIYNRALSGTEIVDVMSQSVTDSVTADLTAPTVTLTAPAGGAVSGLVGLAAEASDADGIGSVEFLVDGQAYGPALLSEPYQASWHARSAAPGSHELRARATDFAGNVATSVPVTVSVDAAETVPGLVAAFGFDEGSGEDVHDATGAGHDTVRSGQSWVTGKYGSALQFDGSFLEVEQSYLLDFTTAMTVTAWVLPKAGEHADAIVLAKERPWEASYLLNAETWYGGPQWAVQGSSWDEVFSWTRLPVTQWSHLAATYDADVSKLYVNGELVAEGEIEGPIRVTDTPLHIGGTMSWESYFHGRIDEVRLYNRALSGSEVVDVMSQPVTAGATADLTAPTVRLSAPADGAVAGLVGWEAQAIDEGGVASVQLLVDGQAYGFAVLSEPYQGAWHSRSATPGSHELRARATDFAGNVSVSAPVLVSVDAADTVPGLVAAFGFDEGNGEDVHDATGAGHDTVRSGQSWVAGKYGSALQFDENYLTVASSPLLDLTTAMTLSAWVLPKSEDLVESPVLAKEQQWDTSYLLKAVTSHGGPELAVLGSTWGSATSHTIRLPVTRWSHLAGTYDGAHLRLYVDGELAAESEFEEAANVTDTPLRIGGTWWGDYFRGRIDEVRIYNRALSGGEIAGLMSQPVTAGTATETTVPVVSLTEPSAGPVTGMVALAAEASDDGGVASVEFLVDGAPYGPALLSAPYQASWHSRSATAGSHELRARATDFAGNVSVSAPVTVSVDAADTVPGLVAAYAFDEGSGDDVHDGTGAGHDTVRAGQSWVVGKYGSALEFEEGFLEVEGSHLLDLTTSMTLSAWLLPKAGDHEAPVLAKANENEWEVSYLLKAGNWHHGPEWALLGSSWGNAWTYTRLPSTKWSHLAGTYDGERLRLYLDGELAAETEFQGGARVTDTPLRIGGTFWGDYFRGRIDEIRIYNRALSASEIVDVMSQPLTAGATGDTTGPVVSLTTPAAGPVTGMVALAASASDEGGVASVEFLVDGAAYGPAVGSEPYQASWHARSATPGSHELRARATDFAGNVSVSAPVTVSVAAADTVPGLVAAFGFDEGSGEDVHDATGAGHDTVRSGQGWVAGKYGSALEFQDGFLEVEGSHLLDLTTAMTVSVWVLPKSEELANLVLLAKEHEWETSYVLNAAAWHGGPEWALLGSSWGNVSRQGNLPATRWSHLAGTYDGAWLRLYVDGELAAETEFEGGAHVTDTPLRIGGMTWGNNFRGRIDEVRIYNRALSGSEIVDVMSRPVTDGATADVTAPTVSLTAPAPGPVSGVVVLAAQAIDATGVRNVEFLVDGVPLGGSLTSEPFEKRWHAASATPGTHELRVRATDLVGNTGISAPVVVSVDETDAVPGLVAAYGFDEGSGEDVHDATGAGHDTVLTGQSWAAGKYGSALGFDGEFLTVADSDLLDLTTAMTLSAWVQPSSVLPDWPTVVMKETAGNLAYALYAGSSSGEPSVWYTSETAVQSGVRGGQQLQLGLWTHLAATFDGAHLRMYVNGEATAEVATDASIATSTSPLRIGGNAVWDPEWFYGLIDEVRIYNRALSEAEIEADMARPVSEGAIADTIPPQVAITSPGAASVVFGSVALRAQATDAYGIESVQFLVDGVAVGAPLTSPPFETSWASGAVSAGSHSLQALAFDRSGNNALSAPVLVTVSETPPACDPATVSDANPCTSDSCNAEGQPVFAPLAAGTSCSDGDRCNGLEACNGAGICWPGTPPSTDESCDAVDDDCDGQIDEDFAGAPTSCGVGACARAGNAVCQNGSVVDSCAPGSPAASDATCNGIDDDCDGVTDENYVAVDTSCGVGTCAASGTRSCVNGAVVDSCSPGTPAASDATCNGIDDDCNGVNDEDYVPLVTTCGVGACAATGSTRCEGGAVVSSCAPGAPAALDGSCDGVDNDCDGSVDEEYQPEPISCGTGVCARQGETRCASGSVQLVCTPGTPAADDATCNGADDDCDGTIDENYAPRSTTCGAGSCTASGTTSCQSGHEVDSCHAGTGEAGDTVCNGIDDDCNGTVDEDYVPQTTSCGVGVCAATGTTECRNGAVIASCTPGSATGDDANCNGVDDDCDGSIDEGYVPVPLVCGVGACRATGVTTCSAGVEVPECTAGMPASSDATCDGIDNDCDGSTDEGFSPASTVCGVGACAATGTTSCVGGVVADSCAPGAAAPADASCDGVDDDCNGQKDEDFVSTGTSCGVGACAATGTTSCVNGTLQNSCAPGTPALSDATCNGVDEDCDGVKDDDYVAPVTHCGVGACVADGHERCVAGQLQNDCQAGSGSTLDATCNGSDDDCDGSTDEDYLSTATSCGTGACRRSGNLRCQSGNVVDDCSEGSPAASDATCDGVDDDCNGSIDEDYLSLPTQCAVGSCQASGATSCIGGVEEDSCTPATAAGSDETCDGLDNDCDGTVDDGYQSHATSCGVGACARTGVTSCSQGIESNSCSVGAPAPSDATCNGVDDDCDGSTDEDYVVVATTCGVGACAASGSIRCQAGSTVVDCNPGTPAASDATCNGVDDDCNGAVDEDYVPIPTACGVGACAASGSSRCEAGVVAPICTPGTPAALDATCDGIDNDCDGSIDEDYQPEPISCGTGVCVRQGETRCTAGSVEPVCTPGAPAPSDATCNGADDDCNGSIDEDYAPRPTTCGVGRCSAAGTTSCQSGQEIDSCQVGQGEPSDSVCNGIDDDCNGTVDEDYVPQATTCGVGVCAANGTTECRNGVVAPLCTPGAATGDDTNCNGVDDDCDGFTDEAYVPMPLVCGVGACHATGVTTCSAGVEVPECTEGTPADGDASCDGVDDDCDGVTDEDYASSPTSCGVGECARTGNKVCTAGHVIDTCASGTPATSDATCDGKDDDCSGAADEDYAPRATSCGVGACASEGSTSCSGGVEQNSCTPHAAATSDSTCNNVDDDCNGSADEDFVPVATSCGRGACASQGSTGCSAGQITDSCQAGTPAANDASCDGADDDCDGSTDEDYVPQATVCGIGACRATGAIGCQAGHTTDTCTPLPATGTDNDCDGVDDDCDGSVDEAYAVRCAGSAVESCSGGALQTQQCADQDACNGSETCAAGHCVAGTPLDTDDDNACTADGCNESGGIVHTPLTLGASCGQAKVCDGQGACIGKPVITTQPSSISVSPGAAAAFGVSATGALLSYQWRRLGQPIPGATSATLTLSGVELGDSGAELTVAVSNPAGTIISSTAVLTVTDTAGPLLTIDGAIERDATGDFALLTGTALDAGQPASAVLARSDRFPGDVAGVIDPSSGAFRLEVPISPGTNALTIIAKDASGNATQQALIVKLELSRLPRITLTEPTNGLETDAEHVDVRGSLRSSLPPEQIRLVLGARILFPSGSNGEYTFAFEDVALNLGPNLLTLRAETPDGTVTAMAAVLRRDAGSVSSDAPVISVIGGASEQFVKDSVLPIKGTVSAKRCTSAVTVNGNPAELKGSGSEISFSYSLALPAGDSALPVVVLATDCDNRIGRLEYTVHHDDVAPAIELALAPSPAVHNVSSTPYLVVGKITEANLATVTSNQQNLGVLPGTAGTYDFTFAVPLTRGLDEQVTIEAVDQAGNHARYAFTLHLDAAVDIEVISPVMGAEIQTLKDPFDLDVVARVIGLPADHSATARLDGGGLYPLSRAESTFRGTIAVRGTTGSHNLAIQVKNGAGTVVAEKAATFSVKDANSIPLQVQLRTPANGSSNIEANEPVVLELNRPVADPKKIKIQLTETVHGKRYKQYESGSSFGEFTNVQLEDVNRDQAPVPGGMSVLPGDRLFAFYPARDYGYGAQVTIRVTNDGAELFRGQFNVRSLPTLISGFVADQFYNPIEGLEVRLADVPANTISNVEGAFSFGFGRADAAIPAGRHLLVLNPGLKNRSYGTIQQWVNTQAGRLEDVRIVPVPLLDSGEPFRRIRSNQSSVLLRGGDLELDLSQASLAFPDGATEGDVHTNVFMGPSVGYQALKIATPFLTYGLQPMGIEVSGQFSVNFALPSPDGSNYLSTLPDLVLLIGLDPDALMLVPVGVGRVDREQHRVRSARALDARRLDFIGMAPLVDPTLQALLSKFADGEMDMRALVAALEGAR